MSSLKDDEPHLVLVSDKTIPKVSESEELESLRYQLKILKEQIRVQSAKEEQQEQLAQLLAENSRNKRQLEKAHALLQEKESRLSHLQQLVEKFRSSSQLVREELQKAHAKEKEVQRALQASSNALQVQRQNEETALSQLQAKLAKETKSKQEALDEAAALYIQFDILKKRVVAAEQAAALLQQKEAQLQLAEQALQAERVLAQGASAALDELKERAAKAVLAQQEAEEELRFAQQHLAKKVKECAELSEKLKKMENQLEEALSITWESRSRSDLLQAEVEQQRKQAEERERQFTSIEQSAKTAALEAEDKYHKVYEAFRRMEGELDTLKEIEEKYQQLQLLWANFNGCFSPHPVQEEKQSKKPFQNLFDLHHPPKH
jgi:hypothetical protein